MPRSDLEQTRVLAGKILSELTTNYTNRHE
jgi:hypothetical protein